MEKNDMIKLEHKIQRNFDLVSLEGRLTVGDASSVSDELHRILEEGNMNLSLDMSKLEFIDSSSLSIIVSAMKFARKGGGDLVLVNVNSRIMTLLKLTRLHEILEIYDDEKSLLESFG